MESLEVRVQYECNVVYKQLLFIYRIRSFSKHLLLSTSFSLFQTELNVRSYHWFSSLAFTDALATHIHIMCDTHMSSSNKHKSKAHANSQACATFCSDMSSLSMSMSITFGPPGGRDGPLERYDSIQYTYKYTFSSQFIISWVP